MRPPITVTAVGDLMFGDSAICPGFGLFSRYAGNGDALFSEVRPMLSGSDLVFGNLEAVLSFSGHNPRSLASAQMRGDPTFAGALRRVGFDVISVANNHADQHGELAFAETVAHLESVGIKCCGLAGNAPWECQPSILTRSGMTVGVLAYSCRPRQYGKSAELYAVGTPEEIRTDVQRLRAEVDSVIVSLHWGEEFVSNPSAEEVDLGHSIIDAGAALVLGHHPHVIRPVERYGSGIIAYSLGNFITDMLWQPQLREGILLRCKLSPEGVDEVHVAYTHINESCRPALMGEGSVADTPIEGLELYEYREAVQATVRAQRLSAYGYALRNIRRYPLGLLLQLISRTLRGKLATLLGRQGE